jgi:hypothetical protein
MTAFIIIIIGKSSVINIHREKAKVEREARTKALEKKTKKVSGTQRGF